MYVFCMSKIGMEIMANVTKTLPLLCISFDLADNNIQAFVSFQIWVCNTSLMVFKSRFSVSDC